MNTTKYGPYSFSRIDTYDTCPLKFKFAYIDQITVPADDEPEHEALARGSRIHKNIEMFFTGGENHEWDPEIREEYISWFIALDEEFECNPEYEWAVDSEWNPTTYDDPNAMLRGSIDLRCLDSDTGFPVIHYDWKTGKPNLDKHRKQLHLYATAEFSATPQLEELETTPVYLDRLKDDVIKYKGNMIDTHQGIWNRRVKTIEEDEDFIPMPHYGCRWCKFSKGKGGPCKF